MSKGILKIITLFCITIFALIVPTGCSEEAMYGVVDYTSSNGSVTTSYDEYKSGDIVFVTVTPADGYKLKSGSLKYDDIVINDPQLWSNETSFTMPSRNVVLTAEFILVELPATTYSISVSSTISNGTIGSNKTTAAAGETITLSISATSSYRIKASSLKYNDNVISTYYGQTLASFSMPNENVVISAEFEKIPVATYTISLSAGITNGTVTPSKLNVAAGEVVTLTIVPDANYRLQENSLKYGTTEILDISDGFATFAMPAQDVRIYAIFEKIPVPMAHGISVQTRSFASITPNKTSAFEGEEITLTIATMPLFVLVVNSVEVNNVAIGNLSTSETLKFIMPNIDVYITFEVLCVRLQITSITVTPMGMSFRDDVFVDRIIVTDYTDPLMQFVHMDVRPDNSGLTDFNFGQTFYPKDSSMASFDGRESYTLKVQIDMRQLDHPTVYNASGSKTSLIFFFNVVNPAYTSWQTIPIYVTVDLNGVEFSFEVIVNYARMF